MARMNAVEMIKTEYFKLLRGQCKKCTYIPFAAQTQDIQYIMPTHFSMDSFIQITCRRCGFDWPIKPFDALSKDGE